MALICAIVAGILVLASTGQCYPVPCDHPLRIVAPHLFQHCNNPEPKVTIPLPCKYSSYTEWKIVPDSTRTCSKCPQCETGQTYQETRTRTSNRISCTDLTETKTICFPGQEERLIIALGLGSSGYNLNPTDSGTVSGRPDPNFRANFIQTCPASNYNPICTQLRGHAGQRSTPLNPYKKFSTKKLSTIPDLDYSMLLNEKSHDKPVPFDRNEHGPRLRWQAQTCAPNDTQHVLFVLDSSGSIGNDNYQRMKDAIGKLVPLFCKQIKVAMVTFSTQINLDFCFNCFQNTYKGREEAKNAITRARYHGSLTNTGATTKCICEELLSPNCGIPSCPSCLDVVYITDGRSNGGHNVCDEVKCLHRQSGINTYAIGINNYDQEELNCISKSSSIMSAFHYNSFDKFESSIQNVTNILASKLFNDDPSDVYSCYQLNESVSPTGAAT